MFKCVYSKSELQKFLIDFHNISGIITGIHDSDNGGVVVQGNIDRKTFCRFCSENSSCYVKQCENNDKKNIEKVKNEKKILIYDCHMGFSEALIPIVINGEALCVIFLGQINCSVHSDSDFNNKVDRLMQIDSSIFDKIKMDDLYNAYLNTTYCEKDLFKSYIDIAELCARSIYYNRWIKYRSLSTYEAFINYVKDYVTESHSIQETATMLNISVSHLSRIIKSNSGMCFTEYIHREKVNYAKKLLTETDMSIKNIALSVGIGDINYFARLFKKYTSTTCCRYRADNSPS